MARPTAGVTSDEYRDQLMVAAGELVTQGLAESTRQRYATGIRRLVAFADDIGWTPEAPVSEGILCLFVASLVGCVATSTIKSYLCAVYSWHVDEGVRLDYTHFLRLKRALKGAERIAKSPAPRRAVPVTMAAVQAMGWICSSSFNDTVFMAIASLATAGLFRLGELVPKLVGDVPAILASRIVVSDEGVSVTLDHSKTDPLGHLGAMHIARTDSLACPRFWINRMRRLPGYPLTGSAFMNAKGRQVTREWVIHRLNAMMHRAGLSGERYSGHSFRRGGATSLAAAGVPDHIIARLGRWKSATYQLYVAATPERMAAAQREMAASTCLYGVVSGSARPADARSA